MNAMANGTVSYKSTAYACYIGNFVQSIVVNLTPILFIPLKEQFGFTYSQFGLLVLINFITQVVFDFSFSRVVDKYGYRIFMVMAHIFSVVGFFVFAITPMLFKGNEFLGFAIGTFIFSGSGGLLELLLSPIIDAIPTDEKEKAMTILHSFYSWGQLTVVLVTTLFLYLFGKSSWQIIVLLWTIVPFLNIFLFTRVPINQKISGEKAMKIRALITTPIFIIAFVCMFLGAASEVTISQWSSTFLERGLDLPKVFGDLTGMAGFALMMAIGRLLYGIKGSKLNVNKALIYSSFFAFLSYIIVGVSPYPALSIGACIIAGIFVSLLWPCTLVIISEKMPYAGTALFAFMACGGDLGASFGPWFTGVVTDFSMNTNTVENLSQSFGMTAEQLALRIGILVAAIFPLILISFHIMLRDKGKKMDSILNTPVS